MEFEIGMKVVCVASGRYGKLIVDKIYTILDICNCCQSTLDVGEKMDDDVYCVCTKCRKAFPNIGTRWSRSKLFVPLQEYTRQEELVKELIEPIKIKV